MTSIRTFRAVVSSMIVATLAIAAMPALLRAQGAVTMAIPDRVKWSPADHGLSTATLEGDPSKAGPYAWLMRLDDGAWIPAHFHNVVKRVVVISGTLLMRHSTGSDSGATHRLPAGALAVVPAKQTHAEGAEGKTVILLIGEGPLQTTFVQPSAAKKP